MMNVTRTAQPTGSPDNRGQQVNKSGTAASIDVIPSHVDELFKRWTSTLAHKMKLKREQDRRNEDLADLDRPVDIVSSAFEPVSLSTSQAGSPPKTLDHKAPLDRQTFDELVEQVRQATALGVQPRLNAKGSSGSYFARSEDECNLGIFKPKDEEPYGHMNPKLTKWIHRNFLSKVIPFGRACLIPQLSYLSEAAASLIDRRLGAYIVPRTEVVELSSPAFFYDYFDRQRAKSTQESRRRPLPPKPGSFQVFMPGFTDASTFFSEHPYRGQPVDRPGQRHARRDICAPLNCLFGRADAEATSRASDESRRDNEARRSGQVDQAESGRFVWNETMLHSFRLELEKLVVLDYLIRNTDRGMDNFMIKACVAGENCRPDDSQNRIEGRIGGEQPHMHIAAIDNSLAFPHSHPLGWRTYTYGWLYLPVALIGRPFSDETRQHYLPLLSSPKWWAQTTCELRNLFKTDPGFQEKMFRKQIAVMKGQALNLVESLKNPSDGPIELCRRSKKLVWDDLVRVPDDESTRRLVEAVVTPQHARMATRDVLSPLAPVTEQPTFSNTLPMNVPDMQRPKHLLSHRRGLSSSTVLSVSLLSEEEYGSLTGVSLIRHMDKLEAQDRSFRKSLRRKMPRTAFGLPPPSSRHGASDIGEHTKLLDDVGAAQTDCESDSELESNWGAASAGDVRNGQHDMSVNQRLSKTQSDAHNLSRSTPSLDVVRRWPDRVKSTKRPGMTRHRSDTTTSLPPAGTGTGSLVSQQPVGLIREDQEENDGRRRTKLVVQEVRLFSSSQISSES